MVVTRTCGVQVRVPVNRRCSTDRSTRTARLSGASSSGGNNASGLFSFWTESSSVNHPFWSFDSLTSNNMMYFCPLLIEL